MGFLFKSRSKRRGAFPAVSTTTTTTGAPTTTTTGVPTTTTTAAAQISIAANDATVTVYQGGAVDITVTLTRTSYTDTVTLTTSGLPSGVTASYPDGQTFTGGATSRVVRLTATGGAPLVTNDAIQISASGSGVSTSNINGTVTVIVQPAFAPNEASVASGFTELFDLGWDEMNPLEAELSPSGMRWYNMGSNNVTTDVTAPNNGGNIHVYRHPIPADSLGGGYGSGSVENQSQNWRRAYGCFLVKLQGSGGSQYKIHDNEEKFVYPVGSNETFSFDIAWQLQGGNWVHHLDTGFGTTGVAARLYQTVPFYPVNDGVTWNMFEYYMQMNSVPGTANGVWKAWVNGTLIADYNNVIYQNTGAETLSFKGMRFITVRGGGNDGSPTPPGGQFRVHGRSRWMYSPTL